MQKGKEQRWSSKTNFESMIALHDCKLDRGDNWWDKRDKTKKYSQKSAIVREKRIK